MISRARCCSARICSRITSSCAFVRSATLADALSISRAVSTREMGAPRRLTGYGEAWPAPWTLPPEYLLSLSDTGFLGIRIQDSGFRIQDSGTSSRPPIAIRLQDTGCPRPTTRTTEPRCTRVRNLDHENGGGASAMSRRLAVCAVCVLTAALLLVGGCSL